MNLKTQAREIERELINSSVARKWTIFPYRKIILKESIQCSNWMEYRPLWKVGTREIGPEEICDAYFCIEIWKKKKDCDIFKYTPWNQPVTEHFPLALPLTRIVYWKLWAVTFAVPLSTFKKRVSLLNKTPRRGKGNQTNTDQYSEASAVSTTDTDQGKCVFWHILVKEILNSWLEMLCSEPKLNSLYKFFFHSISFSYVLYAFTT